MDTPNHYAGAAIDRVAGRRDDSAWIAALLRAPATRLVPVWRARSFVAPAPDPRPATLAADLLGALALQGDAAPVPAMPPVFLGLMRETAYFAIEISHIAAPERHPALAAQGRFEELRQVGPLLGRDHAGLLAYARAITYWHDRHRFCGACGAPTLSVSAGHARRCTAPACGAQHFPRTDPAVIMLVHDGARVILGRSPRFPPGMYSILAGFVEPGESLEETVAREVFEEVGVRVADIAYRSSQPWPFPGSLMIGFTARATSFTITPDAAELEDARWFSRAELLRPEAELPVRLPRPDSIARRLLNAWLNEAIAPINRKIL